MKLNPVDTRAPSICADDICVDQCRVCEAAKIEIAAAFGMPARLRAGGFDRQAWLPEISGNDMT